MLRQKLVKLWDQVPYKNLGYKQYDRCFYYPNGLCKSRVGTSYYNVELILTPWTLPNAEVVKKDTLRGNRDTLGPLWYAQLCYHLGRRVKRFSRPLDVALAQLPQVDEFYRQLETLGEDEQRLLRPKKLRDYHETLSLCIKADAFLDIPISFAHDTGRVTYFLNKNDLEILSEKLQQEDSRQLLVDYLNKITCTSATHTRLKPLSWGKFYGYSSFDAGLRAEFTQHLAQFVAQLQEISDPDVQNFLATTGIVSKDTYLTKVN